MGLLTLFVHDWREHLKIMNNLIEESLTLFPAAKKVAVENFTFGYEKLTLDASQNLAYDKRLYGWSEDTVNAIVWVLRNKTK